MKIAVSRPMLERLPMYIAYLKEMSEAGVNSVSSTRIAKDLGLGEIQVRKELSAVSGRGKPRIGYQTDKLISDIREYLGENSPCEAVIVGAGKLGLAILGYGNFDSVGVHVGAAFDIRSSDISCVSGNVFGIDSFKHYCREHNVKIGIITVPASAAQEVCDLMLETGIEAIWNFAPTAVKVPDSISVINENLAISLSQLRQQINQ